MQAMRALQVAVSKKQTDLSEQKSAFDQVKKELESNVDLAQAQIREDDTEQQAASQKRQPTVSSSSFLR